MSAQQTQFSASTNGTNTVSVTFTPTPACPIPYSMPTVDASNPDTLINNSSGGHCWLSFGSALEPVGPTVPGSLQVKAGQTMLLTSKASVLAAAAANPNVTAVQAGNAASATVASVLPMMSAGPITVTRGVATPFYVF